MEVGYIRVSTQEQNTSRQVVLMEQLGVERVFTDRMSGKNTERPELQKMLDFVREGDTLIVESFSRFARSTKDLLELTATLESKGVQFVSKKENIDTHTPQGKFMLVVFGAMAELERESILQRQSEGIAIAKAEGRMGRPRIHFDFLSAYADVKAGRKSASKVCRELGIARSTWYRRVEEYESNPPIDYG